MAAFLIFLSGLSNVILGSLVFSKKPHDKAARLFLLFSISASLWLFPSFFWRLSYVYLWAKVGYAAGVIFALTGLMWTHALCEIRRPRYYIGIYAFALILFIISLFDNTIILRYSGSALTRAFQKGAFFDLYSIFLGFIIAMILFRLWQGVHRQTGLKKIQIKYIGISTLCFGGWVMLVDLVLPTVFNRFDYTMFDTPSSSILIATTAYVTFKYRLLNIQILIRKGFIYGAIALFAYGMFHLVAWSFLQIFDSLWSLPALISGFFIALAFALVLPFVQRFFIYVANTHLYATIYDAQDTFQRLINNIVLIRDLKTLTNLIISAISSTFKVERIGIVVFEGQSYRLVVGRGINQAEKRALERGFATWTRISTVVAVEELDYYQYEVLFDGNVDIFALKEFFKRTGSKLIVPLRVQKRSLGIIAVGAKHGDRLFTKEDIALLDTLGKQASIGIDNALLYQDLEEKNRRLQQVLEAQREFLDIASHELRTPISIIRGAASMLVKNESNDIFPKKEGIVMIHQSAVRMNATVDNLLLASRLDTVSAIEPSKQQKLRLCSIIERILETLRLYTKHKKIEIEVRVDKEIHVVADERYLEIVLTNLFSNAIKYSGSKEGGRVEVTAEKKGDYVRIQVKDNGIGVPEEDQKGLYQKFVRGANAKRFIPDGTGLGLFIVRRIMEAHGGKYGFESTENRGSVFWVEFKGVP